MGKTNFFLAIFFLSVFAAVFFLFFFITACSMNKIPEEVSDEVLVFFCPDDRCDLVLERLILNSKDSVHCAFFDLKLKNVIFALEKQSKNIDVKLVVDADNKKEVNHLDFVVFDRSSRFMHNKFCIFDDEIVLTGSFNPTERGAFKNNNNVVVIKSSFLAKNFEAEFSELWNGIFGKGNSVFYPKIIFNGFLVENYFCPEDWCGNKILYLLDSANESIKFMIFSFTHKAIAEVIVKKSLQNVSVSGIQEKSQNSVWNVYSFFKENNIDVVWDGNNANMHHKVFIIDDKITITGSFNPSKNADIYNDENIIIFHDEKITAKFLEEFKKIYELSPESK